MFVCLLFFLLCFHHCFVVLFVNCAWNCVCVLQHQRKKNSINDEQSTHSERKCCPRAKFNSHSCVPPTIQRSEEKTTVNTYENATERDNIHYVRCYGFCFFKMLLRLFVCLCVVLCLKRRVGSVYRCATVKSKQTSKEYQLQHRSCFVQPTALPFVRRVFSLCTHILLVNSLSTWNLCTFSIQCS